MNFLKELVIVISLSFTLCCEDMSSCGSFSNKVVIVTGGSSGIGASTAISFAKEGAYVTIVGRNETRLKQVADQISQCGKPALIVKAELTNDEEAQQVIQKTVEKFGKIDVLVNCAGFTSLAYISADNFVEEYDKVMNTNIRTIVVLTNCAIPYLKKTKGNIINISSIAGERPFIIGQSHYSVSKAAVLMFTKTCAMEFGEFGIRANAILPGAVETNFLKTSGLSFINTNQEFVDNNTPLKIVIQPEEIADLILYLASVKARTITGSGFVIDSGYLSYDTVSKRN